MASELPQVLISPVDVVFASPPWGGPGYAQSGATFSMFSQQVIGANRTVAALIATVVPLLRPQGVLALFLPKNLDIGELARSNLPHVFHVEVEANYQRCRVKDHGRTAPSGKYVLHESSKVFCLLKGVTVYLRRRA